MAALTNDDANVIKYTIELVNLISFDIGEAISPINEMTAPWIICCLENYAEILRRDFPYVCGTADEAKDMLSNGIIQIKTPVIRK